MASFAQISPTSPLALLTLRSENYSQNIRLDLDKGIALDQTVGLSLEALRLIIRQLSEQRTLLVARSHRLGV